MSNYTITTNFTAKDSLPSGDSSKIIKGAEFGTEFTNIATAITSKADTASPTFTGTVTAATVSVTSALTLSGVTVSTGTIDGGTY